MTYRSIRMSFSLYCDILHLFLQLLWEIYTKPKTKLVDLRAEKSKHLGRRKICYPDNWSELYRQWQAGEITGRDFMTVTGIKRGTFYHRLRFWRSIHKHSSISIFTEAWKK